MPNYEPSTLLGLGGYIIGALAPVLAAAGAWAQTVYGQRRARHFRLREKQVVEDIREKVAEVHDEVKNTHSSNLRDDLDQVKAAIERLAERFEERADTLEDGLDEVRHHSTALGKDINGIRQDLGGIRGELRTEREDRVDFESRARKAYKREHPGAEPL